MNQHLNKMYGCCLDEIEDFRFDVKYLTGARNPMHPLSRRRFADSDGPAPLMGDPDLASQQELFSRLDRDAPAPEFLATFRVGWANTRRAAAAALANAQDGDAHSCTQLGARDCI